MTEETTKQRSPYKRFRLQTPWQWLYNDAKRERFFLYLFCVLVLGLQAAGVYLLYLILLAIK